jgi:hypothetical protein
MANVISSIKTVQERLLDTWQAQQATAKARPQTTSTETSRGTTSFQALLSGKAVAAPLAVTQQTVRAAATVPAAQTAAPAVAATAATATQQTAAAADDSPGLNTIPTAESVFGDNPWVADPTGIAPNGESYGYNPLYFATASTAAQVAQMVGGTVVTDNELAPGGGFLQQQPNEMVKLSNGTLINPGLVAAFYTHGYPQSYIDQMIANEVSGT